ncbi:hypothetical protein ACLINW_000809 [Vibrio parahaemolyticus]|uniref:hypothetical protein n=1 Tax=Gammaproteobacteria TaxID=1236 RepID=UPI001CDCDFE8|nr:MULTISPECIES: hypothetical protein [Vibrio]EJG1722112.1 hypothetical protein [Vibrio parahaemolyticus]EJG1736703.1 hypothetical protein [Vibrio parahaemolyticus]EJG1749933.1 hypothetical protein [Vibrio parahaemolyticus]EJG1754951.1 hypothetical protein [Vibrio parahaemolyticus]MCA2488962.1 hypothetical protein [Vibrio alginolyticus]
MSKEKNKAQKVINKAADTATDSIEAIMPATTKAGGVVNRVASLDKAGVDHEVIALQMTKNSARGNKYEKEEIPTLVKVYEDCKTRVPLSAKSARTLVQDQEKYGSQQKGEEENIDGSASPSPSV